jgi:hypothetical protein
LAHKLAEEDMTGRRDLLGMMMLSVASYRIALIHFRKAEERRRKNTWKAERPPGNRVAFPFKGE